MESFSIHLTGVGGQGIGLLSELLLRAADHAGHPVKGVDTHGLAQRGGIVVSQIRLGTRVHAPLVPAGGADLVVALERHEALRGMNGFLKDGGTLAWYDTCWQPLDVRLGAAPEVTEEAIRRECERRRVRPVRVYRRELADPRMQNVALLAAIDHHGLVPGVMTEHYRRAMDDLMAGAMLEANLAFFEAARGEG